MIMKDEKINFIENQKMAIEALGGNPEYTPMSMSECGINALVQKENARKFNDQVEKYEAQLEENNKTLQEAQKEVAYDINRAEIKPMLARIIVKPFKVNPFQKMETKGGIIVDAGGYTPHAEINPATGRYEEQKQFIVTGCVVEVGPEVKYLQEGDVVYYRVDTAVPVPFLKQGFVSINENQVIAVVNEGLTERFNSVR